MPTNYSLVYGPLFRTQAVVADLVPREGDPTAILALDDTTGVEIADAETVLPVARVRFSDLAAKNIAIEGLDKGTLTLDGQTWEITSAREEKTPSGRSQGLVMLQLERQLP